jgi:molybdate transport system substrate-binding protein
MRRALVLLIASVLVGVACSSSNDDGVGASGSENDAPELTVFAASSLTAAFTDEIGPAFEAEHAGTTVTFNFASSDSLASQIQSEGSADVFASASGSWMDAIEEDPGVTDRIDFAKNRLVIITPTDDPAGIASIEDLTRPGVKLVLAADGVPVGDYAREVLEHAGILTEAEANVVSNEEDNAGVVSKITAGEADAAIVYESDVSSAAGNEVRAVQIPDDVNVVATYPIAVVEGAARTELATAFVAYITGTAGQRMLRDYGFETMR